ncbi:hypothetical protein JCM8208_003413, partial [Rhodotorula glutinis]
LPPWHTSPGQVFLIADAVVLAETWLAESSSASSSVSRSFPATAVETSLGRMLLGLQAGSNVPNASTVISSLQELQWEVRRRGGF